MKLFHIHRFKTVGMQYEQPCTYFGKPAYMDYQTKKCRCGKEKHIIIQGYLADKVRLPINHKLTSWQLTNKQIVYFDGMI